MAKTEDTGLAIKLWGVRGTRVATGLDFERYGQDTICFEVIANGASLMYDLGSGAAEAGKKIVESGQQHVPVLFSHLHMDHVMGFPLFPPCFRPGMTVELYSAMKAFGHEPLEQFLREMVRPPFFPMSTEEMPATFRFHDIKPGDSVECLPDVQIRTVSIPHPDGVIGCRFDYGGKSIGILIDSAPIFEDNHPSAQLMKGVDCLLVDATFALGRYVGREDWGHSTWSHCVHLAKRLGEPRLIYAHHDPTSTDDLLDEMSVEARKVYPRGEFARQGDLIQL